MRISDWSSDVCSSDLSYRSSRAPAPACKDDDMQPNTAANVNQNDNAHNNRNAYHYLITTPAVPIERAAPPSSGYTLARKSVVWGTRVSVRVAHGGSGYIKQQTNKDVQTKHIAQ